MKTIDKKFNSVKSRRGSALIMVIVLTVLLSLIAAMFILTSRVDEMSTKSMKTDRQLSSAVDVVVERIEDVLVYDIYASGNRLSKTPGFANEVWDYPKHNLFDVTNDGETFDDTATFPGYYGVDDDAWLANLEPEMVDMAIDRDTPPTTPDLDYGFRHITDLYGTFAYLFDQGLITGEYNSGNPLSDYVDQQGDRISMRNLRAVILKTDDPINVGDKADADGEGVSDSRWFIIPNMKTEKGEDYYAAVRIIDNSAMINVNTALRQPEGPHMTFSGEWNGSQLSHVNLEGITDPELLNRYDAALVQSMRYGTVSTTLGAADFYDYLNDIEYEVNAARRLSDPTVLIEDPVTGLPINEMYLPFDIGDELELRNRFFLTTSFNKNGTVNRLSQTWPITFNPQGDPGRGLPFGKDPADTIVPWYDKVGPNAIGSSNRRHYSTAFNNENGLARVDDGSVTSYPLSMDITWLNEEQKIGITLPLDIQDGTATTPVIENFIKRLAMGIYRGLPEENFPSYTPLADRFGTVPTPGQPTPLYTREQLAFQMAVNMVDYQDKDASGTETITTIKLGNTTYYGTESIDALKKNMICVSKIGYRSLKGQFKAEHYGIEVFNPDDDTTGGDKDLSDYKIIVVGKQGNKFQYSGEIDLATIVEPGNPSNTADDIEDSGSADGINDTIVLAFNDIGSADSFNVGAALNAVSTRIRFVTPTPWFDIKAGDKIIVIHKPSGMPVDSIEVPQGFKNGVTVRRRVVFPGTNFLLPATSTADPWIDTPPAFGERLGDVLDPEPDGSTPLAELIDPGPSSPVPELEFIGVQLAETDKQLSNIAEIENVLAVGTRYMVDESTTPATYECTTLLQAIAESYVAVIANTDNPSDPPAEQAALQDAQDMKTFGRISLTDPDYWGLLDSLTYFDPARDGVDLQNIAEGIVPTVTAGTIDPSSDPCTITDGLFFSAGTVWDDGTVFWTDPDTVIQIDLGSSFDIYGLILQTDGDDDYTLEYQDGTQWVTLLDITPSSPGMQTYPDYQDDGKWRLLSTPVITQLLRIQGTNSPTSEFSLSEFQVGVNIGSYEPYLYGDNIAGRININTAPWFVINQLPWAEDLTATDPGSLAQAIVAFRDKAATPLGTVDYSGLTGREDTTGIDTNVTTIDEDTGFKHIAQLTRVMNNTTIAETEYDIRKYIFDGNPSDPSTGDYTVDTVDDDFEERNLIFHRISNLVTVRSDVFTAYIVVRIGTDGPERRMMAIFDRSGVNSPTDKPKLVAIQPVPDPR